MRRGHCWLDLAPVLLECVALVPDSQRLVSVPHVIEDHEGADGAQDHYADLKWIALALPLFQELLVEEVEVECHARPSF